MKEVAENIGIMFLDSGAHGLYSEHVARAGKADEQDEKKKYAWYQTDLFWDYVDSYADFVKKNQHGINYYANVDVIYNPNLTWKVQKYLEDHHGLSPVPVIHSDTPLKWVKRYLKEGYEYIGLGGLGQGKRVKDYFKWADQVFDWLCPRPERLPVVRTHGFAMTSWKLMTRYPWWSVDSASWAKGAGFGGIYIPQTYRGKYTFRLQPYAIKISEDAPKTGSLHFLHYEELPQHRGILCRWLEEIGVPLGETDDEGNVIEKGVLNDYPHRAVANLKYYTRLAESLPDWPWPFRVTVSKGFFDV